MNYGKQDIKEVNELLSAINNLESGYSIFEFLCNFYEPEYLRIFFEKEHEKFENGEEGQLDEKQIYRNIRYMFKQIKLINPKQWRILKTTYKKLMNG